MFKPKYLYKPARDAKFAVEYACTSTGAYPAEEFLDGLDLRKRAKITALVERFHLVGKIMNDEQFKMVGDQRKLFYFKIWAVRLMGYYPSGRRGIVVLTHGFEKKGGKLKPSEVDRAKRIKREYEAMYPGQSAKQK